MTAKGKGPLSKVEKFYIEQNCSSQSTKEIAKDISRSVKAVEKHLASTKKEASSHIAKAKSEEPNAGDLMIRNEKYGVSIMSQEASMSGDDSPPSQKNTFNPNVMHKIKKEI